jgi:rhodanese-related sulfurtransferase
LIGQGAALIDARPIADFAAGHIPESISNELRPAFATWLGWLVDDDRPLVFVLSEDADRNELVRAALKVGYEHLAGELAGGFEAWQASGRSVRRISLITPDAISSLSGSVIDVRQGDEFLAGHLPDAVNIELGGLPNHIYELPEGPLLMMCGHGQRAMTAASLLEGSGRIEVSVFRGTPDQIAGALSESLVTAS